MYVLTSRDLRRLESSTRSPIFSGYTEALKGIITLRAFSAETRLLYTEVYPRIDDSMSYSMMWRMSNRWLMLRIDLVGGVSVFLTQILALACAMTAGFPAVAIAQVNQFTLALYWLSREWADLEQELTSIERVVDYLPPQIPQESPQIIEDHRPPAGWPSINANVKFDNVVLRYDPSFDPVLKGLTFEIKPGEKIGIVGRTGSGKSTLTTALLRFTDPDSGSISIEGIDIRTIGLRDLRSRISFIPQDPVLFSGTVRDNLDPFNEYTDEECADVLARVRLGSSPSASQIGSRAPSRPSSRPASVHGEADGDGNGSSTAVSSGKTAANAVGATQQSSKLRLDSSVAEAGGNLSQGQRQLLAMARALLSKNQIIAMDEATANVDFGLDQAMQAVIRERFGQSMLLVVAHRLSTVVSFDRILVLDAGRVAEFDTPAKLLSKTDGVFYKMASRSGLFDTLVRMAGQ